METGYPGGTLSALVRHIRPVPLIVLLMALAAGAAGETRTIMIVSATEGGNCGAPRGNATRELARACDGRGTCPYVLARPASGRPAARCRTDLFVEWRCNDTEFHNATMSAGNAPGSKLLLSCVNETGAGK
ncbi:hypothetical protein B0G77_3197 [Paraburkholderia sp. BL10I2N1]|nr:hypothetical protein B0G77_3197 [Paraburkholderia sp. BL10I2N1]